MRLQAEPHVLFAFLFGSRAAGRARPDSDWDVAVYVADELDVGERFDLHRRLITELADYEPLDLTLLNEAPTLLAHRALMGRELFIKDRSAYVRFFVHTLAMSWDEAYWRRLHAEARFERLREGRFGRP